MQATTEGQATLTFWIPERIDLLLAAHERSHGLSRSELLRGVLRQYLYGIDGDPDDIPALPSPTTRARRGKWGGRMTQFGKNIIEAKLVLPRRWHDDLSALASHAGITRSHFAREILAQHMLGHVLLPERNLRQQE